MMLGDAHREALLLLWCAGLHAIHRAHVASDFDLISITAGRVYALWIDECATIMRAKRKTAEHKHTQEAFRERWNIVLHRLNMQGH